MTFDDVLAAILLAYTYLIGIHTLKQRTSKFDRASRPISSESVPWEDKGCPLPVNTGENIPTTLVFTNNNRNNNNKSRKREHNQCTREDDDMKNREA